MPSSLVQFIKDEPDLLWGRADIDGLPYRGPVPPLMTEDEAAERLVTVADAHNKLFDLSNPADNAEYLNVINKIAAGWGQCIKRKHFPIQTEKKLPDGTVERDVKMKVYMEWLLHYMQDGKPSLVPKPR